MTRAKKVAAEGPPAPPRPEEERRDRARVSTRLVVRFESGPAFMRAYTGYTANIGAGGLCLITRRSYQVGEALRLRLDVEKQPPIEVTGAVAWVRPGAAIGVRFDALSDDQRKAVESLIDRAVNKAKTAT
jgi:uncharacterized protein (TIGR02266 family)